MTRELRWMIVVSALGIGTAGMGAGVRHYHARPQERSGIPAADYQPPHPPPVALPALMISSPGLLLTLPTSPLPVVAVATIPLPVKGLGAEPMSVRMTPSASLPRPRMKFYQFPVSGLTIDHCSITRVVLIIQEDGRWRLSLQADQNDRADPIAARTAPTLDAQDRGLPGGQLKQVGHLKRNLFVIRFRGLGAFAEPIATPPRPSALGKPVLLSPPPINFWVQSGVPYTLVTDGLSHDAALSFDQIDRVEIEFIYR